ncbi:MAG TPA: class I tRNA ligase family protein, partial [Anaerolineales bacterium]|nr:class I tRNA ligase family protein [Anaerolineales bacterium]
MSKNILVAVAWPYANAEIHVGNITGAYLPADIFARYHRLCGNHVLMVSRYQGIEVSRYQGIKVSR